MDQEPTLVLDHTRCAAIDAEIAPEWLLTNGIGGYAMGNVGGTLDRRYHGLLVAPAFPPLGRQLVFVKADAAVQHDDGSELPLHSNRWGDGVIAPRGHEQIAYFALDRHLPVWQYRVDGQLLEHRIWMTHGRNQTSLGFRLPGGAAAKPLRLRIGLIASFRDHHAVNGHPGPVLEREIRDDRLVIRLPNGQTVQVAATDGDFTIDHDWIENFYLRTEDERGLETIDRHPRVGWLEMTVTPGPWHGLVIAFNDEPDTALEAALANELRRMQRLTEDALPGIENDAVPGWVRQLAIASDSYLFTRQEPDGTAHESVIAGYPWFGDWGRDTMIALPGLTFATGRPRFARRILETFGGFVRDGLLPNVFPGSGDAPDYNTVDAALWFIEAWRAYLEATDDYAALRRVFPALVRIIAAYRGGTRYGIGRDPADGLLRAGEPGQQLTWMDARVDGREVTARHGKPVEINALWFNALRSMATFARHLGAPAQHFDDLADAAAAGFARFDRGDTGGLFDVLDGPDGNDASIRPNQLLALSLTHSPVTDQALRNRILAECREQLLTPVGLRTLAPSDPRYRGRYVGGVAERDGGYHQGPAWTWLLGHYALAEYRVDGDAAAAQARLEALAGQLNEAVIGQLSELHDGDAPHRPRGAPAQAWSVACTLEAWWRLQLARGSGAAADPQVEEGA